MVGDVGALVREVHHPHERVAGRLVVGGQIDERLVREGEDVRDGGGEHLDADQEVLQCGVDRGALVRRRTVLDDAHLDADGDQTRLAVIRFCQKTRVRNGLHGLAGKHRNQKLMGRLCGLQERHEDDSLDAEELGQRTHRTQLALVRRVEQRQEVQGALFIEKKKLETISSSMARSSAKC